MKNFEIANAFFERILGPLDNVMAVPLTGWEAVEILWPLNDLFRPHFHKIQSVRYRAKFERPADKAIEAFAADPRPKTWQDLPAGVWRVLLERHQQFMVVALANEAAGNIAFTHLPDGLPARYRMPGLMLLWLHSMQLPFPVRDESQLELPEGDPPDSLRPH